MFHLKKEEMNRHMNIFLRHNRIVNVDTIIYSISDEKREQSRMVHGSFVAIFHVKRNVDHWDGPQQLIDHAHSQRCYRREMERKDCAYMSMNA
jgi:hypothetical protein